jgi:hypothetical protein
MMHCGEFREVADSYLADELLVETNHDVIAHLEACADCRRELAARRELGATLRTAFVNAEELRLREQFAPELRTKLRAKATVAAASPDHRRRALLAIAAGVLLAATSGVIVVRQRESTQSSSSSQMARVNQSASPVERPDAEAQPAERVTDASLISEELAELATGDHRDCAIGHRLPDRPIDLAAAGRKHDPAYVDLAAAVLSESDGSSEKIELLYAHWCVFKERAFAHLVLRHRGRIASLLVTRLQPADGSQSKSTRTEIDPHKQVIACSIAGDYRISCFRTAGHAIFVVSDLEEAENLGLARRLAPAVYEHITRTESLT